MHPANFTSVFAIIQPTNGNAHQHAIIGMPLVKRATIAANARLRIVTEMGLEGMARQGRTSPMDPVSYRRHRFPPPIIQHAIWLYLRFTLSYRDVEELLAERGLEVSYETVQRWPHNPRSLKDGWPSGRRPIGQW